MEILSKAWEHMSIHIISKKTNINYVYLNGNQSF